MGFKDYYKILGVTQEADSKEIKTAYRKLARKFHPDMNPEKGAEDKFKDVAEAWHVLKDTQRRAEFDELLQYGYQSKDVPQDQGNTQYQGSTQFNANYSDFFNSIFGGRTETNRARDQDVEVELPLNLEDTVNETSKTIEYRLPIFENGQKKYQKKQLKVAIPKGLRDGEIIRLKGQGNSGMHSDTPAGDLYLHVHVLPHRLFEVEAHNLVLTLPLAPWEAALGSKVTVPTLTGKIQVSILPNTPAGKKLRIKGKGLSYRTNKETIPAGDLIVIVKIVMPKKIGEKGKNLWRELAQHENFNPREEWAQP